MRLLKAKFTNYKRFESQEIDFDRPLTILVGRNNSGKTTILEAIGSVLSAHRSPGASFLSRKAGGTGTALVELYCHFAEGEWNNAVKLILHEFPGRTLDLPAITSTLAKAVIKFKWELAYVDGASVRGVKTTEFENPSVLTGLDPGHHDVARRAVSYLAGIGIAQFAGVMFLSPDRRMQKDERFIPFNELRGRDDRNELIRNGLYFLKKNRPEKYVELIDRMKLLFPDIEKIDALLNENTGNVDLELSESGSRSDIIEMGSGTRGIVMMLSRILAPNMSLALLDEPDINLHPGLVSDLAKLLEEVSTEVQIIISSHHEAFVNEIDPGNILHVRAKDKQTSQVVPLDDKNTVMGILNDLGIRPANFGAAEATSGRVIVVGEGDTDWKYLRMFASKLGKLESLLAINAAFFATGGKMIIEARILDKMNGSPTPFVLVRDRDEYDTEEIDRIEGRLGKERTHFLKRREIENYALDYKVILNTIKEKGKTKRAEAAVKTEALTDELLKEKVRSLADQLKMKVLVLRFIHKLPVMKLLTYGDLSPFVEKNSKKIDPEEVVNDFAMNVLDKISGLSKSSLLKIMFEQKTKLDTEWTEDNMFSVCPGKDLLKSINEWTTEAFGINVSMRDLILRIEKVDDDMVELINKIINAAKPSESVGEADPAVGE